MKNKVHRISISPHPGFVDLYSLSQFGSPGISKDIYEIYQNPGMASSLTHKGKSIAIVSNGSSVLGLGNLGAHAVLPVLEMKSMIYAKFAGINAFPIAINVSSIEDFITTLKNISLNFSAIHLEDIRSPECFRIEQILTDELDIPVVHIDQHGTAVAILAGLINAAKVINKELSSLKVVISGAGAAGLALVDLLSYSGLKNISIFDSKGILHESRSDLTEEKKKRLPVLYDFGRQDCILQEALSGADVFIGLSVGNILKKEDIRQMGEKPIVFALSSPIPEIMPEDAIAGGAYIIGTGRADYPNQINNMLVYPGLMLGLIESGTTKMNNNLLEKLAISLASLVENPSRDEIIPSIFHSSIVSRTAHLVKNFS